MQGGEDPFGFGDPFGNFGGFGGRRNLMSDLFGGRDPFDDPFFRTPFRNVFESSFIGSNGGPFMNPHAPGFLEHQPPHPSLPRVPFLNPHATGFPQQQLPQPNLFRGHFMNPHASGFREHQPPQPPQSNMSRGPVIEELDSDSDEDEKETGNIKKENPRKHGRSNKEPIVEDPDYEATEKKIKHTTRWNDMNQMQHVRMQPEVSSFTFQSSSVSYGGPNGTFYTTSRTRRSGTDGLMFEEFKEADSATRQATHRVSRGIHDKGHSVSRKLKSDGNVDTMQTLHNLNEDELVGFEQTWKGSAPKHLPGWSEESASRDVMRSGRIGEREGWALPSIESSNSAKREVGRAKGGDGDGDGGGPSHSGGRSYRGGSSQGDSSRSVNARSTLLSGGATSSVRPASATASSASAPTATTRASSSFGARVSNLIDGDPSFRRSRSVVVPFLHSRNASERTPNNSRIKRPCSSPFSREARPRQQAFSELDESFPEFGLLRLWLKIVNLLFSLLQFIQIHVFLLLQIHYE